MKRRRTADTIGAKRIKLAQMLQDKGHNVEPEDIRVAQGYYRIHGDWEDSYRWEAYYRDVADDNCSIGSFDTISDCVRYGFEISTDYRNMFEVHTLKP